MPDIDLVAVLIATAAICSAVLIIWKALRYVFTIDRALPVLLKIASEFENNSGSTMKDKVDKLLEQNVEQAEKFEQAQQELVIRNNWAVKLAEDSRLIAQTNAKIVEELTSTQTTDLLHLREYIHEKMGELNNQVGLINLQAAITEKRSERIEKRLDRILPSSKQEEQ